MSRLSRAAAALLVSGWPHCWSGVLDASGADIVTALEPDSGLPRSCGSGAQAGFESCQADAHGSGAAVDPSRLRFHAKAVEFALVSDLDKASRDPKRFSWHSLLRRGVLHLPATNSRSGADRQYRVEWLGTERLESLIAVKNRSMELSELISFEGGLFAVCDITGIVFEIDLARRVASHRWILADGDGMQMKPFKSEWATVKDGVLLIGSMGREWVRDDGSIESYNNQWVKSIDRHGRVQSLDWRPAYEALRFASNTTNPGYLWHEAIVWDSRHRRWLILPRKASSDEPYSPESDERRGTNFLFLASEDFKDIEVRTVGPLEPEFGFSALRKVPGTEDTYMALKVLEVDDRIETKLALFDSSGQMLLDPPFVDIGPVKYEGLEFLGEYRSGT